MNRISDKCQKAYDAWLVRSGKAGEALSRAGAVSPALYSVVQRAIKLAFAAGRDSAKREAQR